jgi:hypothetical protein
VPELVETKQSSRLVPRHQHDPEMHDNRTGNSLQRADHGEVKLGGAMVGTVEGNGVQGHWATRGESSGLKMRARSRQSELREQLSDG